MTHRGFTLIELLMVVAILAILAGMAMPMIGMADRSAKRTNSQARLTVTLAAVNLFRQDVGAFPFHRKPDPSADGSTGWTNDLALRLGHVLTADERTALSGATRTAEEAFRIAPQTDDWASTTFLTRAFSSSGSRALTATDISRLNPSVRYANSGTTGNFLYIGLLVNRAASRRASTAILAGHTAVTRLDPAIDATAVLAQPAGTRGFCDDYLGHDAPASARSGEVLIDAWGHPLAYFCAALPGASRSLIDIGFNSTPAFFDPAVYGLGPMRRAPAVSLDDDLRTHAGSGWRDHPELWSVGGDGAFHAIRRDPVNRDNLGAAPYLKGLP